MDKRFLHQATSIAQFDAMRCAELCELLIALLGASKNCVKRVEKRFFSLSNFLLTNPLKLPSKASFGRGLSFVRRCSGKMLPDFASFISLISIFNVSHYTTHYLAL